MVELSILCVFITCLSSSFSMAGSNSAGICQDDETTTIILNLTMSWSEGWTECQKRNGSMASEEEVKQQLLSGGLPENEYWTGMHQYLSDWIGVVGWDYESTVRSVAQSTHEMDSPSPGACQELCQTHVFAVSEGTVCFCIPDSAVNSNSVQFRTNKVSVWTRCNNTETPNTCGGTNDNQNIASLYRDKTSLVTGITQLDGNCLSARCDNENGYPFLQGRKCEIHMPRTCENSFSSGTGAWDQTYSYCLDVSSIYASQLLCPIFTLYPRSTATTYWVGYKKQFYTRKDTGSNVRIDEVQKCQCCNVSGICQYLDQTSCSIRKSVICKIPNVEELTTTPLTTTAPLTTLTYEHTREISTLAFTDVTLGGTPQSDNSTTLPPEHISLTNSKTISSIKNSDDGFSLIVILSGAGAVITLITLISMAILCVRLKKKTRNEFEFKPDNKNIDTVYKNEKSNKINSESNGEGKAENKKDSCEHVNYDEMPMQEENVYDVTSSDIQNVYNHLQLKVIPNKESECNDYDVSSPVVENNQDIYNHLREDFSDRKQENVYDVSGSCENTNQDIYNNLPIHTSSDSHYAMYDVS